MSWIVEGFKLARTTDDKTDLSLRICRMIAKVGTTLPQIIFRVISRREIEVPVVALLLNKINTEIGNLKSLYKYSPILVHHLKSDGGFQADDPETKAMYSVSKINSKQSIDVRNPSEDLILLLRTVLTLCKDLNLKPAWVSERWSLHWSFRDRFIISRDLSDLMFLLWHHYKDSHEVELKSICVGILVYIADKVSRSSANHAVVRSAGTGPPPNLSAAVHSAESDHHVDSTVENGHRRFSKEISRDYTSRLQFSTVIVPAGKILPVLAISLKALTKDLIRSASIVFRPLSDEFVEDDDSHVAVNASDVRTSEGGSSEDLQKDKKKLDKKIEWNKVKKQVSKRLFTGSQKGLGTQKPLTGTSYNASVNAPTAVSNLQSTEITIVDSAAVYALKSEAVLYVMEGIRIFLCSEESKTLHVEYEHYFVSTPLCVCLLYLMEQYPSVGLIQKYGLELLLCLCNANSSNINILGENCKCIVAAMISWPADQAVHITFCTLVLELARTSERIINALIFHAIYKWLFIPIKYGWSEVAPIACAAISIISNTVERAQMVGASKICEVLVAMLGKNKSTLPIQIEGLRAVLALAKSDLCLKKMKADGGKKILNESKEILIDVLHKHSNDDIRIPSKYDVSDLKNILATTIQFPQLFDKNKCNIS